MPFDTMEMDGSDDYQKWMNVQTSSERWQKGLLHFLLCIWTLAVICPRKPNFCFRTITERHVKNWCQLFSYKEHYSRLAQGEENDCEDALSQAIDSEALSPLGMHIALPPSKSSKRVQHNSRLSWN